MKHVKFAVPGIVYHSDADVARYRDTGSWIWSTAGDALRKAAADWPDDIYISAEDGDLTFAELDRQSESFAAALLEAGLKPGDRALFQIGTVKEIIVALFGCFKAAVLPVCTLPQYREIEIGQLTKLSGATAYIVQADFSSTFDLPAFARKMMQEHPSLRTLIVARGKPMAGELSLEEMAKRYSAEEARERTRDADPLPGDAMMLQLSGGSTGVPKIIPRMHAEYLGSSAAWSARHKMTRSDIYLWALPLIHNAGMILKLIPAMLNGCKLIIQSRFDVADFLDAIQRHRVTYTGSIGPIAPRVIEFQNLGDYDLGSLRMFFTLSRAEAVEAVTGVETHLMYGITEGMLTTCFPGASAEARHETLGWPTGIDDEAVVLRVGTEERAGLGETGEFCFRGAHTLRGYFNAPEISAESFTSDGFFRTGDLVRTVSIDGRVHYIFEGRLKDNINRGGEKFGAEEVENLIVRHPSVNDVRVVAMPDSFFGEKACAFIILNTNESALSVDDLGRFLLTQGLAKFKLPERVEIIGEFPVTRVGKVDKQALRHRIADILAKEKAQ